MALPVANIADLGAASALTGAELIEVQQGGINSQTTAGKIRSLAGGQFSSYILPSGDVTGATDTAAFIAEDVLAGTGFRTVTGESDPIGYTHTLLGSGTYYINTSNAMMNPANKTAKVRGRVFEGQGSNLTTIVYTGTGPMCTNLFYQNVQMYGIAVVNLTGQDFFWSQEQAGVSNIQYNFFEDVSWDGTWGNVHRLTGGNNNSEFGFNRCVGNGATNFVYAPPAIATTITSGQANIALANSPLTVAVNDTVSFNATVGSIAGQQVVSGTQYYCVASTTTTIQVAATRGGAAIVCNASGTPTISAASDQFLNYWFHQFKFGGTTNNSSIINMGFGGSISLVDTDISGWRPTVDTYLFNLLRSANSSGACSFKVAKMRIEHSSDHALLINSNWDFGNISFDQLDQSSQVGSRTASVQYSNYNFTNRAGPLVEYSNSQLIGTLGVTTGTNNYNLQSGILIRNCQLLQNEPAAFVNWTNGGNSGGAPRVRFQDPTTRSNAATTTYQPVLDTDLFWNKTVGGLTHEKIATITGANSDFPAALGATPPVRLPLNAAITKIWFWKPAGGNTGAFQYTLQTLEGSPTVLAGGAATAMAGSNAGLAIPLYQVVLTTPLVLTTDLMRTLQIVDTLGGGRTGIFTNLFCLVFYIG